MQLARVLVAAAVGTFVVLAPMVASPHIAPSVNENNRYLKLSLAGDRIRMVYTVYMGEVPGQAARRRMDTNGDGGLAPGEADRYGQEVGATVAAALELTVDGQPYPVDWSEVHVGLGTPAVAAGSFAIDLVAWLCLEPPEGDASHRLVLFDRFEVPQPGETELRVEPGPGITVERSSLGEEDRHSQLELKWLGGGGPMSTLGYVLQFRVDPELAPTGGDDAICPQAAAASTSSRSRKRAIAATGAAAAIVLLIGWSVRRTRRRTGR